MCVFFYDRLYPFHRSLLARMTAVLSLFSLPSMPKFILSRRVVVMGKIEAATVRVFLRAQIDRVCNISVRLFPTSYCTCSALHCLEPVSKRIQWKKRVDSAPTVSRFKTAAQTRRSAMLGLCHSSISVSKRTHRPHFQLLNQKLSDFLTVRVALFTA